MVKGKVLIFLIGVFAGAAVTVFSVVGSYGIYTAGKNIFRRKDKGVMQTHINEGRGENIEHGIDKKLKADLNNSSKFVSRQNNKDTPSAGISILINTDKEIRKISPLIYGSNLDSKMESEWYIKRFVQDIGITIFRFPGGHSGGYHWKQGKYDFYDRNEAPLREIDNVIDFCKDAGAQLVLGVNITTGTPEEAASWVKYMNQEKNFKVNFWEIGNEVYGNWDKDFMPGNKYAEVIKVYATAMKAVDPTIKIGADWGGEKYDEFDRKLLKGAADYIDFVSYHWYPNHTNEEHIWKGKEHPEPLDVIGNTPHIAGAIQRLNRLIEDFAPHRKGKIEMAFLEWDGSWDAIASDPPPYEQGRVMWSLANAIFYADCLGQFAQNGVTAAAHYELQSIMFGLIRGWDKKAGWGGQTWDMRTVRPKAYAIKIFSEHFGDILLEVKSENIPVFYKEPDWWNGSYSGKVPYISCYASKHSSNGKLGIIIINKHSNKDFEISIDLGIYKPKPEAELWVLNGPDILSQNDGFPETVRIEKSAITDIGNKFTYIAPAHSVSAIEVYSEGIVKNCMKEK